MAGDVIDGDIHQLAAVGIGVIELCGRLADIVQTVVLAVGIWVAGHVVIVDIVGTFVEKHLQLSVGRNNGAALTRIVVHSVIIPYFLVIVDMKDEESVAHQFGVPSCELTVLEHVEFVGMGFVADDICLATLTEGCHTTDVHGAGEFDRGEPSGHHLLVAGIASRTEPAAIVAT